MLDELVVRNLGVLRSARIEPGPGLTVVSGETGTGKTLLLGALRLLLGEAARPELVGPFDSEASVEGRFLTAEGAEVVAGRRLSREGRSRAYLDGSMASAAALDEVITDLVELIGQHDHLRLSRPTEIRGLVDRLLKPGELRELEAYRAAWKELQRLLEEQELVGGDRRALERERDLLRYQVNEIEVAGFAEGDDVVLEQLLGRLRNVEEIRSRMAEAGQGLDAARDHIGAAVGELRKVASLDSTADRLAEDAAGLEAGLGELAMAVAGAAGELETDPEALEEAEQRLRNLTDLRRKYGPGLAEVLGFAAEAADRAGSLDSLLDRADRLSVDIGAVESEVRRLGSVVASARESAAARLAKGAVAHLKELGFGEPIVRGSVEPAEPGPHGADITRLLFASDERLDPAEIRRVASGGELSRLVLSLRLAGGSGMVSTTLAFDEIDAGVGGTTALALGRKLAALASGRQVLCVTHLPQVAAFADVHYAVEREADEASVRRVEGTDRLEELARMLAGIPDSEQGQLAAEELLTLAQGN